MARCASRSLKEESNRSRKIAKFREALESGPATPMTREDWASLLAEAIERLDPAAIRP
jgi:hypothetical protein